MCVCVVLLPKVHFLCRSLSSSFSIYFVSFASSYFPHRFISTMIKKKKTFISFKLLASTVFSFIIIFVVCFLCSLIFLGPAAEEGGVFGAGARRHRRAAACVACACEERRASLLPSRRRRRRWSFHHLAARTGAFWRSITKKKENAWEKSRAFLLSKFEINGHLTGREREKDIDGGCVDVSVFTSRFRRTLHAFFSPIFPLSLSLFLSAVTVVLRLPPCWLLGHVACSVECRVLIYNDCMLDGFIIFMLLFSLLVFLSFFF